MILFSSLQPISDFQMVLRLLTPEKMTSAEHTEEVKVKGKNIFFLKEIFLRAQKKNIFSTKYKDQFCLDQKSPASLSSFT